MSLPFEMQAEKLVFGGDALGHHQGRVIFVPRALPGERLEVEEIRTAKGVVHARPLKILSPAPERIEAPCPYFGNCGGCHYQHLAFQNQTAAKREILRETLRRIGKIFWNGDIPVHGASPWNYRNQAQIKVGAAGDGGADLGFFAAESHRLVPVETCMILSPRLNAILAELRRPGWRARLAECREIEMLADDQDEQAMLTLRGSFSAQSGAALAEKLLDARAGIASVAMHDGRELRTFGAPRLKYRVGELGYEVRPGSFFQASRLLLQEFVAVTTSGTGGALALDLFAGVGLLSLPLARQFDQVIAVESNPAAAKDLAENAKAHGLQNIRAVEETVFDFLRRYARSAPDLVALDPPRAGVGSPALRFIAAIQPRRIHYASCHPPTLARDLGYLIGRGYKLNSIDLFDFFPQTYHIESLTRLSLQTP